MERTQKLDLEQSWLQLLQKQFSSARITDDEMCKTMQCVYDQFNYFIDPHTAVAIAASEKLGYHLAKKNNAHQLYAILSTASPCKFEESIRVALGDKCWNRYYKSRFPFRAMEIFNRV